MYIKTIVRLIIADSQVTFKQVYRHIRQICIFILSYCLRSSAGSCDRLFCLVTLKRDVISPSLTAQFKCHK